MSSPRRSRDGSSGARPIAYYISDHGMGHAARSRAIIRHLGPERVVAVTGVGGDIFEPLPALRIRRARFDAGCVQIDGLTVDPEATLAAARDALARAPERRAAEAAWLRERAVRVVVCDIPSLPLAAACEAGIPSALVANFTWVEIYRAMGGGLAEIAGRLEAAYRQATIVYRPGLALELDWLPRVVDAPIVVQEGPVVREALRARARPGDRLAFVYTGIWPAPVRWDRVGGIEGWTFFACGRGVPSDSASVVPLEAGRPRHDEVARSVDLIVAKPGYATLACAMAHGIPVLLVPREGFAEANALMEAAAAWGGARVLDPRDFAEGRWGPSLKALPEAARVRADGAAWIAADLARRFGL